MTTDNPGKRTVRGPRTTTAASKAKRDQSAELPKPKAPDLGKRGNYFVEPDDLDTEDALDLVLAGGETVKVYPPEGIDPALVAARRMVIRAVLEGGAGKKVRARGGLTVVAVPGPEWLETVQAQWQAQFRGGSEPGEGEEDLRRQRSRTWVVFSRDGTKQSHTPERGNDVVGQAAWKSRAVVGFSASPDTLLPSHLTRAPDCRIVIAPLDARMLRAVIGEVTGRPPKAAIPEDLAAAVTPDMLRFARRHREAADAYLARLIGLLEAPPPDGGPGLTLDDIHGMDEAVTWGRRWISDLGEYRAGRIAWSGMDAAALLHGLPGTGKTMFAEALARSARVPLVSASFARWQSSGSGHLGECLKAMRATFAEARRRAPCVLLIDEIDAIGTRAGEKGEHRDYWTAIITGVLELLDGTEERAGVLVIGTTNDPGALDPALVRSGRLNPRFEIRRPDPAALERIFRYYLGTDLADADIGKAARLALGGSGADCEQWVRTARQSARHEERPMVPADLVDAIGAVELPPEIERTVAVHEAGHAVATAVLRPGAVTDVRIGQTSGPAGSVRTAPDMRSTREGVHGTLLELLAGRAAEEVLLGGYSGGSGGSHASDLAMATCLAVALETAFGLGTFGPMWQGLPTPETVGTLLAMRPALAVRVQASLEAAYAEAVTLIRSHREAVSAVADALVVMRSLTGAEVDALVASHRPDAGGATA